MTREPDVNECVIEKGKLYMDLLTLSRACEDGVPSRPSAHYICVLHPDSGKDMPIAFTSIQSVRAFILQFQPRAVVVRVGAGEHLAPIVRQLAPEK